MILFWKIRFLDRADKGFKDRSLFLNSETLDPVTRAALELVVEGRHPGSDRRILKYRSLFEERDLATIPDCQEILTTGRTIFVSDYFEDETGAEITLRQMGPILTGDPNTVLLPNGMRQHDIEFMFSESKPVPVAEVSLDQEEARLLGYFVRDYQEIRDSAFLKDGPGTLKTTGSVSGMAISNPTLETAVSDDEIRSFVTIFRRLYMDGEPANFEKAVAVYVKAVGDHPLAKWVAGIAADHRQHLDSVPDVRPFMQVGTCTFNTKRLLDVFIYTQYAHQPDERRQRQFGECLAQVQGHKAVLTWMFLTELWKCALEIGNAGKQIAAWFNRYCDHHGISPDVLASLRADHSGLGVEEKEEERQARLFREKVEELSTELWKRHGRPEGGPAQFLLLAREQLNQALRKQTELP